MHCALTPEVAAEQPLPPTAADLIRLFDELFGRSHRTRLCAGASEPFYQPAETADDWHRIYFREDFAASALHEVAHWCIAGEARRRLPDYGYWYHPDGRSDDLQVQFQQVEAKPQALEWIFSRAAGLPFRISLDNLEADCADSFPFQQAVWQAACQYWRGAGLSERAGRFRDALAVRYAGYGDIPSLCESRIS